MTTRTIYRFEVPVDHEVHELALPIDSEGMPDTPAGRTGIVHVSSRSDPYAVEVWVQVNHADDWPIAKARVLVTGTGDPAPEDGVHIGSAEAAALGLMWHLWRIP